MTEMLDEKAIVAGVRGESYGEQLVVSSPNPWYLEQQHENLQRA